MSITAEQRQLFENLVAMTQNMAQLKIQFFFGTTLANNFNNVWKIMISWTDTVLKRNKTKTKLYVHWRK